MHAAYIEIALLINYTHWSSHQSAQQPVNSVCGPKDPTANFPFKGGKGALRDIPVKTKLDYHRESVMMERP